MKQQVLVDTQGFLLKARGRLQDRDGGVLLMSALFGLFLFLITLYADAGCQGQKVQAGLKQVQALVSVEIVKRSDATKKFILLPKRWIVELIIGWLNRCHRLAKDWECLNDNGLAFLRWATVRLMLRRLCQAKISSGTDSKTFSARIGTASQCGLSTKTPPLCPLWLIA